MLTVSGCSHPFVLSAGGAGEFPRLIKCIQSFFHADKSLSFR